MSHAVRVGKRQCVHCTHAKRGVQAVRCAKNQWRTEDGTPMTVSLKAMRYAGVPFRPQTFPREPMAEKCLFYEADD